MSQQGEQLDRLSVLISDDHRLFRDGLRSLLRSMPEVELAGEAASGDEAIALAESLQPDVVIMDIAMPDLDGIEATRRIVRQSPRIGVLIVTMLDDDTSVFAAMRAGARGYVLKGADHAEIMRAIRAVGGGEAIFSPAIARRLIDYFGNLRPMAPAEILPELSDREKEILEQVALGLKNAEIARRLFVSPKTVRNHVSNILSKLQVADRTQAALKAIEAGLAAPKERRA